MTPFDLEKALRGDTVVTSEEREVTEICFFKTKQGAFKIVAVIEGNAYGFTKDGKYRTDRDDRDDLFMKEK